MELPIDHFRLLGVSPSAEAEEVLRTFQLRLDRPPQKGFTNEVLSQRSELLRLSADLLSDKAQRQSYEIALLEGASGLELSSNREVAGLLLLWEAKASYQAFKLARKALQPPQAPALGSGRESDLTIVAALACRDAAIEEQLQRRYASASDLLQEGIQLLQRMGKLPEERKTLEDDMEALLPYRILDLLSRDKEDEFSHSEGIRLLDGFVLQRGGLEGRKISNNSKKTFVLSQGDFEIFFQQIRRFLTVQEQIGLFSNWYKRGSSDSGFLCAIALVASGFSFKKPEQLQEARKYFKNLNIQGLDAMPLMGCIDLLLADVKQSEARFISSTDIPLKDWLDNYPGERLAALCDYCRNWLLNDVLPGYRDIDIQMVDLEAWFSFKEVQEYVEHLESKVGLGLARAGFSLFSSLNVEKEQSSQTFVHDDNDTDLAIPGGIREHDLDVNYPSSPSKDIEPSYNVLSLKDFISSDKFRIFKNNILEIKDKFSGNPIIISASVFAALFFVGTVFGLLSIRKPSQVLESYETPTNEAPKNIEDKGFGTKKSIESNLSRNIKPLTNEAPSDDQIRQLINSWLNEKSKILGGDESNVLPLVARKPLLERVLDERNKDSKAGERQVIRAEIINLNVEEKTKNRIAVNVDLNYKDKRINLSGKVVSETIIPSLKVKYVLGRQNNVWKIVDYISGG